MGVWSVGSVRRNLMPVLKTSASECSLIALDIGGSTLKILLELMLRAETISIICSLKP